MATPAHGDSPFRSHLAYTLDKRRYSGDGAIAPTVRSRSTIGPRSRPTGHSTRVVARRRQPDGATPTADDRRLTARLPASAHRRRADGQARQAKPRGALVGSAERHTVPALNSPPTAAMQGVLSPWEYHRQSADTAKRRSAQATRCSADLLTAARNNRSDKDPRPGGQARPPPDQPSTDSRSPTSGVWQRSASGVQTTGDGRR
jgi:hypothetical protein